MHHLSFALRRGAIPTLSLTLALALVACGGGDDGSPAASDDSSAGGTVAVVDGKV